MRSVFRRLLGALALLLCCTVAASAKCRCGSGAGGGPTPPAILTTLAFSYGCGVITCASSENGVDPGATADQTLYGGVLVGTSDPTTNANIVANCPGKILTGTCAPSQTFIYNQWNLLQCTEPYFTYLNGSHEAGFFHTSNAGPRFVTATGQGSCNTAGTGTGGTSQVHAMMPADDVGNGCVYTYWTTSNAPCTSMPTGPYLSVPSGEGIMRDGPAWHYQAEGRHSIEYGFNYTDSTPSGGAGSQPNSWQVDEAHFYSTTMCQAVCIPFATKMGDATTGFCGAIVASHCRMVLSTAYAASAYDNRAYFEPFCAALTHTNFRYVLWEGPVARNGPPTNDTPDLIVDLNTAFYFAAHHTADNCAQVRFADEESNPTFHSEQIGFVWLGPILADSEYLIQPWRTVANNCTCATDVAYWVDYSFKPFQPIQSGGEYHFNGTTLSSGTWCESAATEQPPNGVSGDSGGVQGYIVKCPAQYLPVMRREFSQCWWLSTPVGGCAIIVNTSGTSETIQASWLSQTYTHVITFQGCGTGTCEGGSYSATEPASTTLTALQAVNTTQAGAGCSTYCSSTPNAAINLTGTTFTAGVTPVPGHSTVVLGP